MKKLPTDVKPLGPGGVPVVGHTGMHNQVNRRLNSLRWQIPLLGGIEVLHIAIHLLEKGWLLPW